MVDFLDNIKRWFSNLSKPRKIVLINGLFFVFFLLVYLFLFIPSAKKDQVEPLVTSDEKKSFVGRLIYNFSQGLGLTTPDKSQAPITTVSQPSVTPVSSAVNLEDKTEIKKITDQILDFIKSQYRQDGFYNYYPNYDTACPSTIDKSDCPLNGAQMFETTNAWTALAYLSTWKIEGKEEYLEQAERDLDKLIEFCQEDLKNCQWVLFQFAEMWRITQDSKYLNILKDVGELLLINSDENPMLKNIEVRELALLGEILGEERFYQEAQRRIAVANEATKQGPHYYSYWDENKQKQYVYAATCWNVLAQVELNKRPERETELENTETLINNLRLAQNMDVFIFPADIQPCLEAYFILSTIEGKEAYQKTARKLTEMFISSFWGNDPNKGGRKIVFLNQFTKEKDPLMTVLSDNSYLIYLLSQF